MPTTRRRWRPAPLFRPGRDLWPGRPDGRLHRPQHRVLRGGYPAFDVYRGEDFLFRARLKIPGRHNIYNALAATAVALTLGIDLRPIEVSICSFTGTKRRFEYVGSLNGASVIDDYAHHPTEIRATLTAAKALLQTGDLHFPAPHLQPHRRPLRPVRGGPAVCRSGYSGRDLRGGEINVYNLSSRDLAGKIPNARYSTPSRKSPPT